MEEAVQNAGMVCGALIAAELIGRLCPKSKMLGFVQALMALVLLASAGAALAGAEWTWPEEPAGDSWQNQELNEYVEGQYAGAAEAETERYLQGLLAAAGLTAKKITATINIMEDGSIVLTKAAALFSYESDAQRARALLENALGDRVEVEIGYDGS
ncbi:hypothetical protein D7X94_11735 [Acutalibacter sp. 1XD8-33]|uniref:hypothetical protein n=1 Tax=Acutalibacter sp. 1XD8-33 TaxID=2320081 RepID=UPI000EA0C95C|nr:hypothetical protein [Acutalibacter sp. 1XD8-33]RKJ39625.1 hypothetical protein D7X94_11735 [Acutalibacter sp. 1XD8-33]